MPALTHRVDLPTVTCGFDEDHALNGPNVRVLRSGAGNFIVACTCSEEALSAAHEPEHPTDQHLGFLHGKHPSPEQWLALDELADGWYDEQPHVPVEDPEHTGTPAQLRAEMREKIEDIADTRTASRSGGAGKEDVKARQVECPSCGVGEGQKCERPGGHSVRKCHADRKEAAREEGIIEASGDVSPEPVGEQANITDWTT